MMIRENITAYMQAFSENRWLYTFKYGIIVTFSWVSNRLGLPDLVFGILMLAIFADILTGTIAAGYEAHEHPKDTTKKLDPMKGLLGLLKKLCYIIVLAVATFVDMLLLQSASRIGVNINAEYIVVYLAAFWLIAFESISILDNCARIGVPLPPFLIKIVHAMKIKVEEKGDEIEKEL